MLTDLYAESYEDYKDVGVPLGLKAAPGTIESFLQSEALLRAEPITKTKRQKITDYLNERGLRELGRPITKKEMIEILQQRPPEIKADDIATAVIASIRERMDQDTYEMKDPEGGPTQLEIDEQKHYDEIERDPYMPSPEEAREDEAFFDDWQEEWGVDFQQEQTEDPDSKMPDTSDLKDFPLPPPRPKTPPKPKPKPKTPPKHEPEEVKKGLFGPYIGTGKLLNLTPSGNRLPKGQIHWSKYRDANNESKPRPKGSSVKFVKDKNNKFHSLRAVIDWIFNVALNIRQPDKLKDPNNFPSAENYAADADKEINRYVVDALVKNASKINLSPSMKRYEARGFPGFELSMQNIYDITGRDPEEFNEIFAEGNSRGGRKVTEVKREQKTIKELDRRHKAKANIKIAELKTLKKKDFNKNKRMVGSHLHYLVKRGFMKMKEALDYLKYYGITNDKIGKMPYFRTLFVVKVTKG